MNQTDFYLKFPSVLKKALTDGTVAFGDDISTNYKEFFAHRGITRGPGDNTPINWVDFASYIELGRVVRGEPCDPTKIESYSCSLYVDKAVLMTAMHLPKWNKQIIGGPVNCGYGPQLTNRATTHVDWWLYKGAAFFDRFEVIP